MSQSTACVIDSYVRVDPNEIVISGRHREVDQQHVQNLCASFGEIGQIQPIVITSEHRLVDGAHRLAAAIELGFDSIDAGVAVRFESEADLALLEATANSVRRELTPLQRERLWRTVFKPRLEQQARQRQLNGLRERSGQRGENFPDGCASGSASMPRKTRDAAMQSVGMTAKTLEKVAQLRQWAESEDFPERIQAVVHEAINRMEQSGAVEAAFQLVRATTERFELQRTDRPSAAATTERGPGATTAPIRRVDQVNTALNALVRAVTLAEERVCRYSSDELREFAELAGPAVLADLESMCRSLERSSAHCAQLLVQLRHASRPYPKLEAVG